MAGAKVNHQYHLVEPSPWPAVGAMSAFVLAIGAVVYFHGGTPWVMIIGILGVLYTMVVWWRDIIMEAEYQGHHTPVVQLHMRYGMILFIASEVMFFVAWFWAYFDVSLFPGESAQVARSALTGGEWPPKGISTFNPWDIPLINTLILLTSGTTVTWAHHALRHGDRKGLIWGLACTVALGVIFTLLQAYEYAQAAFGFAGHIYGATFFMATGFHGVHVIVGTIFLTVCLVRAIKGHFTKDHHFGFEAAAWYWHFVDVVWLFLFSAIYVWGAGANAGVH